MRGVYRLTAFLIFLVSLESTSLSFQVPKNDLKPDATALDLGPNGNYASKSGEYTFQGATGEDLRIQGWGDRATRSLWFKFVAPASDQIIITIKKTRIDALKGFIQLGIFEGEQPILAKALGYPTNSDQLITSQLIAGKTYHLIVDNPREGDEIAAFDLRIQTFLVSACAPVKTVALEANGIGEIDLEGLFNLECYWPCSGLGCTRELSQSKFEASHLGDNYITVKGLARNGKTYFGTMLVKVIDTIPPTIVARDFRVNITQNGKAIVNPKNVISWRCKKTASEPAPNPTPDQGEDWFFQEIPCAKDNVGIESFELSKSIFTCDDLGENEVTATVTDTSGNKASTKVKITVYDLTPLVIKAKPIELNLGENGTVKLNPSLLDDGSSAGCSGFESAANKTVFDFNELGENTISYIIQNNRGDMLSTEVTVKVQDVSPPTIVTQEVDMFANMKGLLTIGEGNAFVKLCNDARISPKPENGGFTPNGSSADYFFQETPEIQGCTKDNGQIFEIWTVPREFTVADIGVNEIEVFVSDMAGNTASAKTKLTLIQPELPCKQQLWAIASGDWNDPNIWSDKPNGVSIGAIPCNATSANIKGYSVIVQNDERIEVESIRLLNGKGNQTVLNIYAGQITMTKELYSEQNSKVFKHTEEALKVIKK
ncbi:MAG: hypothetical protein ACJAXB_000145 [Candidatus Endobugula sp.]|jgi:hypothetical protein